MKHTSYAPVLSAFALLMATACSDDSGAPHYASSCERACVRAHDCSSTIHVDTCTSDCKTNLGALGPKLSDAYLSGIDSCIAKRSCNELAVPNLLGTCQAEAKVLLAPSAAAQTLCERVVKTYQECLGLTEASAGCLDNVEIFGDSTLRRAASCNEKPCDQRADCLVDELGVDATQN